MQIEVRQGRPDDAAAIVGLIKDCYGQTYTSATAQSVGDVAARIDSGAEVYTVGERAGRVLGFVVLAARGPQVFECYRCVVSQEARGQGLMRRLMIFATDHAARAGSELTLAGVVTSHPFAQRSIKPLGFSPLGLYLGMIPDFTTVAGIGRAAQPISLLMCARRESDHPRARRLSLTPEALSLSEYVLGQLGIPCLGSVASPNPGLGELRGEATLNDDLGILHTRLGLAGPREGGELLAEAQATQARVAWVDVPAEEPLTAAACAELRALGYGVAAYLPLSGPSREDVIRFQRYLDPAPLREELVHVAPGWERMRRLTFSDLQQTQAVA